MSQSASTTTVEAAVHSRYAQAAQRVEAALCCPTTYPARYLRAIPAEILERDYGCGDPTPYVQAGESVLDLGAGGGKLCYILAQVVGSAGHVIGVDCNREMLALARRHQKNRWPTSWDMAMWSSVTGSSKIYDSTLTASPSSLSGNPSVIRPIGSLYAARKSSCGAIAL